MVSETAISKPAENKMYKYLDEKKGHMLNLISSREVCMPGPTNSETKIDQDSLYIIIPN